MKSLGGSHRGRYCQGSSDFSPLAITHVQPHIGQYTRERATGSAPARKDHGNTLLLASTGGHLAELRRLQARFSDVEAPLWVTFDTPQSRSLLQGERVVFVPFTSSRDWRNILRNARSALGIIRAHGIKNIVSTGPGIALSFVPR